MSVGIPMSHYCEPHMIYQPIGSPILIDSPHLLEISPVLGNSVNEEKFSIVWIFMRGYPRTHQLQLWDNKYFIHVVQVENLATIANILPFHKQFWFVICMTKYAHHTPTLVTAYLNSIKPRVQVFACQGHFIISRQDGLPLSRPVVLFLHSGFLH